MAEPARDFRDNFPAGEYTLCGNSENIEKKPVYL